MASDMKKLMDMINSDSKFRNGSDGVYRDEPIIMPASRMKNFTPQKITEMMNMARSSEARSMPMNRLFYLQGRFMEDFTDSFDYNDDLTLYYPTYSAMTIKQLRGFFSWRTKVRNGEFPSKVPLSFIFMHIYELLCGIGISSPEKGFERLIALRENYKAQYPAICRYLNRWLPDYVVYYSLGTEFREQVFDLDAYNALSVLLEHDKHSDDKIASSIRILSSYNLERSSFRNAFPEDMDRVLSSVYRQLCAHHEKKGKKTYPQSLFGSVIETDYEMFSAAVFYDSRRYEKYEYEICSAAGFSCRNGRWKCRRYLASRSSCTKLGKLTKTIDCLMRSRYEFGRPILHDTDTKYVLAIIEGAIDKVISEKKAAEERKISIDISKLGGIRAAADITRDRLMTESERDEDTPEAVFEPAPEMHEASTVPCEHDCDESGCEMLSPEEYRFLRNMLYGGDLSSAPKCGTPVSIMADSINEKLFDLFGDTVIIFEGDSPMLIEDYTDELKGIIGE